VVHLHGCSVSAVSCIEECDNVIWSGGGGEKSGNVRRDQIYCVAENTWEYPVAKLSSQTPDFWPLLWSC